MTNIIKMPKRFDYSKISEFNTAIMTELTADAQKIILDCLFMDYIDSAGIGLLVMAHKKAQENNSKIAIINIKPLAKEILLLANLQKLIDIS